MVTDVVVPRLGLLMKSGTIGKWLKKEGERVEKGEPLFELEAEKVTKRIEAPESGVLRKIFFPEKATVPVLQRIALIAEEDEVLPQELVAVTSSVIGSEAPESKGERAEAIEAKGRILITPVARKIALDRGLDISRIRGTGPSRRIVREDVLKAIEEAERARVAAPIAENIHSKPLTHIRRTIANRMMQSQLTSAQVTLNMTVDMTEATKLREQLLEKIEKEHGIRISYTDMIAKAVTQSLKDHPILNSTLDGDTIKIYGDIHLGIAVATEQGLMVPVVRNAHSKTLIEMAAAIRELVEKARTSTALIDEITGSTFTVTNLGMFDVETFTPIINPPEVAILGIGGIAEKPVVVNGYIVVRSMMSLSLTVDHRVIDGDVASKFLKRVKQVLEKPYLLII